jgi:hypothetical protein
MIDSVASTAQGLTDTKACKAPKTAALQATPAKKT